MGKVILLSKESIWNSTAGKPFSQTIMDRLDKLKNIGHTVCIISSRAAEAEWQCLELKRHQLPRL